MSRPPSAPAGAVPHTLKTTVSADLLDFVPPAFALEPPGFVLPPATLAVLDELAVALALLLVLLPPLLVATAAMAMMTNRPTMPRQPKPRILPTLRFFGGGGAHCGCCGAPHCGCCCGYCWLMVPPWCCGACRVNVAGVSAT